MAPNDSYLIPHVDGIGKYLNSAYNFIYFLDGNNKNTALSGATGIYKDNNFKEPLIIPSTLKNSLLIYESTEIFYHGFDFTKMPNDVYRKTVNFQFVQK